MVRNHRPHSKLETARPRAPQCSELSAPQGPDPWGQAASGRTGPGRMLRELWHSSLCSGQQARAGVAGGGGQADC